jgi:hypothetical protein
MSKLAANVRRVAPSYFVQTPYFWFPIEPYCRFPFFHWLPESWRYRLIMMGDLGYIRKASSVPDAVRRVQSAVLLWADHVQFSSTYGTGTGPEE